MSARDETLSAEGKSLKGTLAFVGVGLLATLLLGGLKVLFERSSVGHRAEVFAFELLQGQLPYFDPKNPVVVLDTSDITRDPDKSRATLAQIIPALTAQGPLAIGVDWEFSPRENEFASSKDPEFFDLCLEEKRRHGVPIFLGVDKRKAAPPKAWLGAEKYKELAAAVGADRKDTTRLPIWIQKKGVDEPLPLLGYALAQAYAQKRDRQLPKPPKWIRWAVREGAEAAPDSDFFYEDRLVNYSNLEAIRLAAQRDLSATSVAESGRKSYEGKIVILGDMSQGFTDPFNVPGASEPVGGVLLHASAAYTFAQAPLFEFRQWLRVALDLGLAMMIVVIVAVLRYRRAGERGFSLGRQQTKFVYLAMACVVVAGWLLVLFTRVMWLDFLLVVAALFLHPKLEERMRDLQKKRKRTPPPAAPATGGAGAAEAAATGSASVEAAVCLLVGVLLVAPAACAQGAAAQCGQRAAAIMVAVKKKARKGKQQQSVTCYFRESGAQDWAKLSEADNGKRQFEAGQQLRCDKDCVLTILLCGTRKEFDVKTVTPDVYTVLEAYEFVPRNEPYDDPAARPPELASIMTNPDASLRTLNPHFKRNATPAVAAGQAEASARGGQTSGDKEMMERVAQDTSAGNERRLPAEREMGAPRAAAINKETAAATPAVSAAPVGRDTSAEIQRYSEALNARRKAEELYAGLLRLANAERDAKDYATAASLYTQAQEALPSDARAAYGLGNVYADQGQWEEALKSYRRAVELNSFFTQAQLARAYALLQLSEGAERQKRLAEAEGALWYVLTRAPENRAIYALFDAVLEKRGASAATAAQVYSRLVLLAPASAEAHLRLSELLRQDNKDREAAEHLRRAAELSGRAPVLRDVAAAYEMWGRYEEAQSLLRRALVLEPRDVNSLYALGRVLLLREHYDEAAGPLRLAAELSPEGFAPRFLLGLTYLNAGRLPAAEQSFDEAATRAAPDRRALLAAAFGLTRVADAHAKARRLPEAVRAYEHALRVWPDDAEGQRKLAAARAKLRR
ncbi:MAG TPA: tetratricopeptide repeat protein [Pyrinomonadaceae bacterium]|jgi:tetratricopeptide (TPR) repeat protein/CHASE2 domain-containing sensor protein